ncbi:MAG TPA: CoA pyrophosphatase [Bacteroidia bacterium]|jgi:8-oxo-dGTP pyrophosphatase MutT (NUDIX family)|nr:CoA pyrophosphatase [Bacteroidia bacterium]
MKLTGDAGTIRDELKLMLSKDLPGESAQFRMTAREKITLEQHLDKRPDHRKSAVMLHLFMKEGELFTMIIRRPDYDGTHGGQLALPGGKMDKEDEDLLATAIRETREEVNVRVLPQNIIGKLTPVYIPVSNFLVQPFVAFLDAVPEWKKDEAEVAEIIEVPMSLLLDERVKTRKRISIGAHMFVETPCYDLNGNLLWGATAMIFSELEEMMKRK